MDTGPEKMDTELEKGRGHPVWVGDQEEAGELLER